MTAGGYDPNQYPQGGQGFGGPVPGDLGLRLGARVIDGIIVSVVTVILYLVTGSSFIIYGILAGLLGIAYFVAFEVTQGWTPGKKIFGLSVRGPGGALKPDPRSSLIRNGFYLLAIIPFVGGLLELAAIIYIAVTINQSPTKQGKHDELAGGTQVIKG